MHPSFSEDRRQIEHLAPVGFAFLLPYLPYWVAVGLAVLAIFYAVYFSPRWGTTREQEQGFFGGKVYYALTVLALLVIFPDRIYIAAAVWGILAVGDSLSNIVGRRFGHTRLYYNRHKTVIGSVTFWLAGTLAAWALLLWNFPSLSLEIYLPFLIYSAIAAFFCALAESLPSVIDDNLVIGWVGGMIFPVLLLVPQEASYFPAGWSEAIIVNLFAAVTARWFRWLSWKGTILAFVFGILIWKSTSLPGFAVIAAFLILASLATKAGRGRKARLGVEEGNRGQRGIANVLANGLVPLSVALFLFWIDDPLLRVAYAAAVATAAFDTVSTEIGQWLGRFPVSPLTLRRVPVGTQGAVSIEGTAAGMTAAAVIAVLPFLFGWLPAMSIPLIFAASLAGGLFESILASLFVYDCEYAGEALNLYNTLFGATVGGLLWSFY